jgi:hypothetical protein
MMQLYHISLGVADMAEKKGWSKEAAKGREDARAIQQEAASHARSRNMPFEQFVAFP